MKILKQTEEHIRRRIESRRRNGFWRTPEIRLKELTRLKTLGSEHPPWNKGKTYTYEELYGEEKAKQLREIRRISILGRTHSEETMEKMSRNHHSWNKGKHLSSHYWLKDTVTNTPQTRK